MKQVDASNVHKLLNNERPGEFEVLDVRQELEYSEMHLPGARLIPLGTLPDRIGELDPDRPVLVYCRSGGRSYAAAKFLEGKGFSDVSNLVGGMSNWRGVVAEGDTESGMLYFPDVEDVVDVYRFCYGMEMSLQAFYARLAENTNQIQNEVLHNFFTTLAKFEEKHMRLLYAIYTKSVDVPLSLNAFKPMAMSDALEGGVDAVSYLKDRDGFAFDLQLSFELAMSIEAQALDFYSRCAIRASTETIKDIFLQLAREEQRHLRMLSELFDRIA